MNESQKFEVMMYLKKKLISFGCPDSYLQRTADSMTNTIEKILNEYAEKLIEEARNMKPIKTGYLKNKIEEEIKENESR